MTRRIFLTSIAAASSAALARSWEQPAFPDWSAEFVDKLLTESPWARQLTVSFEYQPQAAPPVRAEMYLTIRWASALPVRQALALAEFGRAGLDQPRAHDLLTREDSGYVVEIAGFPTTMSGGAGQLEKRLARSATLSVKGRRAVKASEVRVPEHGMHLLATMRFPRFEDLSVDDGAVRYYAETGVVTIVRDFKLKEMMYHGRLAL